MLESKRETVPASEHSSSKRADDVFEVRFSIDHEDERIVFTSASSNHWTDRGQSRDTCCNCANS